MYYCKFCNKTMNINSKIKHNYSKSHLYLANYIIKEEIYHKNNLKNVEKFIFDCGNRYKYEFNEFYKELLKKYVIKFTLFLIEMM